MTTQAPKKTRTTTAKKAASTTTRKAASKAADTAAAEDRGRWLTDLERSLLRFHQNAALQRGRIRGAHRMPFVQCRTCDNLRRETVASKQRELEDGAASS